MGKTQRWVADGQQPSPIGHNSQYTTIDVAVGSIHHQFTKMGIDSVTDPSERGAFAPNGVAADENEN